MKRITPRTCLWPLTGSLIASFALSLGLTFRSDHHCFAGTCGEWLFPLQARLHVTVWYCWLSLSVTILALRAFHPSLRRGLHKQLYTDQLPVIRKSVTISGVLISFWVLSLYGILVGIWWLRLQGYFVTRGEQGGMMSGNRRVAAVALTGQYDFPSLILLHSLEILETNFRNSVFQTCLIFAVPCRTEFSLTGQLEQYLRCHHGNGPTSSC